VDTARLVMLVLGLSGGAGAGGAGKRGGRRGGGRKAREDVPDTHSGLQRIYKKLGIEREQSKPVPDDERGATAGDGHRAAQGAVGPGLTPTMPAFLATC